MKNLFIVLIVSLLSSSGMFAQNNTLELFRLYDQQGNIVDFDEMIIKMSNSDVALFGELHNNPVCHWMQLKVTQGLFGIDSTLTLGAEMFEADDQLLIDEYLQGIIRKKDFEKYANLWSNYKTDYKPLFEFAVQHQLKFIATNIPRRYASMVSRNGLEALESISNHAKSQIAPLPIAFDTTVTSYVEMMDMEMGHGQGRDNPNIIKAQASKDATMAWFISKNMVKDIPFIHFQGDFHSAKFSGINWYLKQYSPAVKIITISTVEAEDLDFKDDYSLQGDYILIVRDDMTSSY